jgi:hypothetical protein
MACLSHSCKPSSEFEKSPPVTERNSIRLADRGRHSITGNNLHDFGTIFAEGQTLKHNFTLTNSTDVPMQILDAQALKSCCSFIEDLPQSIPPREQIRVPVQLKPGYASGLMQVGFAIITNDVSQPLRLYYLRANRIARLERVGDINRQDSIVLGQAFVKQFTIVVRGHEKSSDWGSVSVRVSAPSQARIVQQRDLKNANEGIRERELDVVFEAAACNATGSQNAELQFAAQDGEWLGATTLRWDVLPRIVVSPEGLTVARGEKPIRKKLVLRSNRAEFRVLACSGKCLSALVELPRHSANLHVVEIQIDPALLQDSGASDIVFTTDDSFQPRVVVSAFSFSNQ